MAAVAPTGFSREAVEACLARISASPHFSRSRRLARFLSFIVASLLEGRADELKERTIGVEVYGRALAYDPGSDPIVRSEAHRLRRRLDAYYAREGSADPIVIAVPKGRYVPVLRPGATASEQGVTECRVIVAEFEDRGPLGRGAATARAIGEALRARLAVRPGVRVLAPPVGASGAARQGVAPGADYRVEGAFDPSADRATVTVRLVRLADGKAVRSETRRLASERGAVKLAEQLAGSIGAALTRRARPELGVSRADDLYVKGRHSAIQYGNTLDPRHLEPARRRLWAAVEREPEYVDALAELAHLELLCLYPPRGQTTRVLARARALLERALATEPRHARSLYLLGHVEGSALRPREALGLTESAVALDPEDAEGRTMLAVRYASLGFWESAVAACEWAVALDPVWEAPYRIKAYVLTRMGRLEAARVAVDELARAGTAPTEVAIARFDQRIAEGDGAGARSALERPASTFPVRPDQEDRRVIALGLADALEGRQREARRMLHAHRGNGPRFWDHTIRLALVLGEEDSALELLRRNPVNRSYRWLAAEGLVRAHLRRPRWRALADDLHGRWLRDLEEVGPRLPAPPPDLPEPADLLLGGTAARHPTADPG